ncbi:chemotaxis protein CheC [Candidatus Stoquefichus sp. SB1]|jgi:chemotaxis protein CheY-P-specific phosphatase CheC|uniref:chemotaxis protein CheC n=1 Tax=Candidatus Stoquefichus sp. SB1 TaxID=1658109 RepID=UPI00067EC7F5|nr:chemotaxis protein CheC [Candidatus Stoquefichus sp. SB1]
MKKLDLTPQVQDIIHELGNIGIGAAATSLFSLVHKPVETTTSQLEHINNLDMFSHIQMQEQVIGILFPFDKELYGFGLFILEDEFILDVFKSFYHENIDFNHMNPENVAILEEVCSLMISAYLGSLTKTTKLMTRIKLPAVSMDMKGSIVNNGLSFILQQDVNSYWLKHEFKLENSARTNHLLFMLSDDCIRQVMKALGVSI